MKNKMISGVFSLLLTATALLLPATAHASRPYLSGPVQAEVIRVVDGDTIVVRAHVWLGQSIETSVRLDGIDTPEMHSNCQAERKMAEHARDELASLIQHRRVVLYHVRDGKYAGRVLASIKTEDGIDLAHYMLDQGIARPYHGHKRQPWCS